MVFRRPLPRDCLPLVKVRAGGMFPSHQETKRSEQVSSLTLYWSGLESSGDIPGGSQDADLGSVQGPIGRLKYVAPAGLYKRVLGHVLGQRLFGLFR